MLKKLLKWTAQRLLTLDGYLFIFSWLAGIRLRRTRYDREFRYFLNMVPERGIILDIGANIGIMTVALAKARPGCEVYAFEPLLLNLRALRRIIAWYRLSNVRVFPMALGDKAELREMVVPEINGILMQGLGHITAPGSGPEKGKFFSIPVERLDEIDALQAGKKIVAVKIDVENYEYFVLQGSRALLQKYLPVIYCELWGDERREACVQLLKEMGYTPKVYVDGALAEYRDQPSANLFFTPPQ
jgi:FkbM family methyltransferase